MFRTSFLAALALVAVTGAVSAMSPYPGTVSRIQDNADQMSRLIDTPEGAIAPRSQVFGAPQGMRGFLRAETRPMDVFSSVSRSSGTSSDRFQDNANIRR